MNYVGNKHKTRPVLDIVDYDFSTISLKQARQKSLNPNQYFFLLFASQGANKKILELFGEDFIKVIRANDLYSKGYLTGQKDEEGFPILTPKFESEFLIKGVIAFRELVETFPIKTPDGDRYYRKNANQIQDYYVKLISKNRSLHRHILACLQYEVDNLTEKGKLKFLVNIDTWVLGHHWEAISPDMLASVNENREPTNATGYSNVLIED